MVGASLGLSGRISYKVQSIYGNRQSLIFGPTEVSRVFAAWRSSVEVDSSPGADFGQNKSCVKMSTFSVAPPGSANVTARDVSTSACAFYSLLVYALNTNQFGYMVLYVS